MECRPAVRQDRKSTRLNSSHTVIYTLSLHDALPISALNISAKELAKRAHVSLPTIQRFEAVDGVPPSRSSRSEEHTSELQSHRDLHSFPTRRSSDLCSKYFCERACQTSAREPSHDSAI